MQPLCSCHEIEGGDGWRGVQGEILYNANEIEPHLALELTERLVRLALSVTNASTEMEVRDRLSPPSRCCLTASFPLCATKMRRGAAAAGGGGGGRKTAAGRERRCHPGQAAQV
jgi:hypothetical protein